MLVVGTLADGPDGGFADDREGLREEGVEALAALVALSQGADGLPKLDIR